MIHITQRIRGIPAATWRHTARRASAMSPPGCNACRSPAPNPASSSRAMPPTGGTRPPASMPAAAGRSRAAVLNFRSTGQMRLGHVAVVTKVLERARGRDRPRQLGLDQRHPRQRHAGDARDRRVGGQRLDRGARRTRPYRPVRHRLSDLRLHLRPAGHRRPGRQHAAHPASRPSSARRSTPTRWRRRRWSARPPTPPTPRRRWTRRATACADAGRVRRRPAVRPL